MRKAEFLQELRESLQGEVSAAVIQENVNYYDSYISQEAASGRREEDVIEEIGSPRLIARTIIDSQEAAGSAGGSYGESGNGGYGSGSYGSGGSGNGSYGGYTGSGRAGGDGEPKIHYIDFSKWYWKLLGVVLMIAAIALGIAVVSGVLTVVTGVMALMLRFAGPLLVIWMFWMLFRGPRR